MRLYKVNNSLTASRKDAKTLKFLNYKRNQTVNGKSKNAIE